MKVTLKDVRLAFPNIWHAKAFPGQKDATPKFNCSLLFPKEHEAFKLVMDAIVTVAKEAKPQEWESFLASIKGNSNKMCFIDGNVKKQYDGFEGNYALAAGSTTRPTIIDRDKSPLVEADGRPYGGCYVNAIVDIWCQTKTYPGIRCTLSGLQFMRDGDAFSGSAPASADEFDDLSDGADAPAFGGAAGTGGGFI